MTRTLSIIIILLCFPLLLWPGTDSHIFDPDMPRMGVKPADKEQIDLLCQLCWNHTYSNPRLALQYGQEALSGAGATDYLQGSIKAHNLIGIAYDVLSIFDSALYHYHYAYDLSLIKSDTFMIASNLTNIGLTHWHTGNFREALTYLFQALNFFEAKKSKYGQAACHNNIGLIYLDLKNSDRALLSFNKSLELYKAIHNDLGTGAVLTNLGRLWSEKNDYVKALRYLKESEEIKTRCNDFYGLAITYRHLGQLAAREHRFANADNYLSESIRFAEKVNDPNEKSSSLLEAADLKLMTNQPGLALKQAKEALVIAHGIKSQKLESEVYEFLSRYYNQLGDTIRSYQYYREYKEREGQMVNTSRINQLLDLELQNLSKRKTSEIAALNRQKNIQELLIEKQQLLLKQRNMMLLTAGVLFLLTVLSAVFVFREIRQRQQRKTQRQMQQLREKQLREILEAELGERKRIGEELHDSLGQSLSLIKLNISSLRDKELPQSTVGNLMELIDGAFGELRTISHNMTPIMLREKGLVAAIGDLVERLAESKRFAVHFETIGQTPRLDMLAENTLYRVMQEIVNNIMHHSGADKICIQVISDGKELTIMTEDNGSGFDYEATANKKGMGLANIRTRMANLGGTMHLDSALNRGTIITLTIPL